MKKSMSSLILIFLLCIPTVAAITIYAGECLQVDLSELESLDNVVYDVVGNSSNLEGLTIDLNGATANICTVPNYKPDNFTIIFIDDSTKEIIKEVPVGGGGGGTKTVYKDRNITKYIDKEIEVIKEVPGETIEKIVFPLQFKILVIVCLSVILIIFLYLIFSRKKRIAERGYEKENE